MVYGMRYLHWECQANFILIHRHPIRYASPEFPFKLRPISWSWSLHIILARGCPLMTEISGAKLIVIHVIRKCCDFQGLLPCSRESAICSYRLLDDCGLYYCTLLLESPLSCHFIFVRSSFWVFWLQYYGFPNFPLISFHHPNNIHWRYKLWIPTSTLHFLPLMSRSCL